MREGSLEAPVRHPLDWQNPDFYDNDALDDELRRVFDICHTCRRCFNLCDSFPTLFDLIDESPTMELDSVDSAGFKSVVDGCTLCDMCFMTKCPYVPPHEFNVDFPHLMLRARAQEHTEGKGKFFPGQLAKTDRNGKLMGTFAGLVNWGSRLGNSLTRPLVEWVAGIDRNAYLPKFHRKTFKDLFKANPAPVVAEAPAAGRKVVLYATCFSNYNNPHIGTAMQGILARNGVEVEVVYPGCCGMPQLEQGDIAQVAAKAREISAELKPWIEKGYDVVALVPSCTLMFKFEWPLIVTDDPNVKLLSESSYDAAEYIVDIARNEGLAEGLQPLDGGVAMHLACHARAQNMGPKAVEMLNLLPGADVTAIERCSGHGGSWGVLKGNFETALKVGKPAARAAMIEGTKFVASECPLAAEHLVQGIERLGKEGDKMPDRAWHPIELMAKSYGIEV
ncbi:MAG: glycerol-3-phosphate dehydrogenase [Alphaproteobacteria bacterium]|nr:MAG: glycerol-3-phosphate dehydrogenase [Alphaproteobacteria bacterium]